MTFTDMNKAIEWTASLFSARSYRNWCNAAAVLSRSLGIVCDCAGVRQWLWRRLILTAQIDTRLRLSRSQWCECELCERYERCDRALNQVIHVTIRVPGCLTTVDTRISGWWSGTRRESNKVSIVHSTYNKAGSKKMPCNTSNLKKNKFFCAKSAASVWLKILYSFKSGLLKLIMLLFCPSRTSWL